MVEFFQTVMGRQFYDGTMPALVTQIKRLNDNIEKIGEVFDATAEKEAKQTELKVEQSRASTREDALEAALHAVLKDVFESEIADGIKYETLTMAVELSNFNTQYPDIQVQAREL
jgi:uncharacterized alpha-E superfamily protein